MIPGRPYPVYVYIYGMALYSSNPKMGQREAAEKTRIRFGLSTFSHTTLGRAMKRLEQRAVESGAEPHVGGEPKEPPRKEASGIPTTARTADRRKTVLSYLTRASNGDGNLLAEPKDPRASPSYKRPPYKGAFIDACHKAAAHAFLNFRRLLL